MLFSFFLFVEFIRHTINNTKMRLNTLATLKLKTAVLSIQAI